MKSQRLLLILLLLLLAITVKSQSTRVVVVPSMGIDSLKMTNFLNGLSEEDREKAIKADINIIKKKYGKSLREYKKLKKKYPCAYTSKKCGDLMLLKKQYSSSIKFLDNAIAQDSLYLMAYLSKINAYEMLKQKDNIDAVYKKMEVVSLTMESSGHFLLLKIFLRIRLFLLQNE